MLFIFAGVNLYKKFGTNVKLREDLLDFLSFIFRLSLLCIDHLKSCSTQL